LQHGPRLAGNSVFLDVNFESHDDQWAFLSTLRRMTLAEVTAIAEEATRQGRIMGVRVSMTPGFDTLFLAMPIAWKGTLAQYVGRLHRSSPSKREVIVHDYGDEAVPMLKRMSEKRVRGYKSFGYSIGNTP
jgi:hypothetical protein